MTKQRSLLGQRTERRERSRSKCQVAQQTGHLGRLGRLGTWADTVPNIVHIGEYYWSIRCERVGFIFSEQVVGWVEGSVKL